jgi:thiamine kinase-like enzyme
VIEEIAARVFGDGVESVEPLGGGITNRNFKVRAEGEAFVLRIGGNDTALLGIDRRVEYGASRNAAALGIGPEVVAFLEPEGYLVTRFVEGSTGDVAPQAAAALLRRLHDGPAIAGRFDPVAVVRDYATIARGRGVEPPAGLGRALELAERIGRRRAGVAPCACHNDLLAANFVRGPDRIWIIDWEYAGMGDPAFDLANFATANELDQDGDHALLEAYGSSDLDSHVLLRFVSDLREAMWGVVQHAISTLEFDFARYAEEHFERLEELASEPRFRGALR